MESKKEAQKMSVARFLSEHVALSGKTQTEIANHLGYPKGNIITMFKNGSTPLPINKVGPMAEILEVDATHLLSLVMSEYYEQSWEAIKGIFNRPVLTDNEMLVINMMRDAAKGDVLEMNADEAQKMSVLIDQIAARNHSLKEAALKKSYEAIGKSHLYVPREGTVTSIHDIKSA